MKFFFDTADTEYIRQTWDKLKNEIDPRCVAGITTNPNALHKIGANSLQKWKEKALELCNLVSEIRQDLFGVVYIQQPNSKMEPDEVLRWVSLISQWGNGGTSIGLKIPPYKNILEITDELSLGAEVNVTGVSDCSTALRAFSYGVRYVSIIPGRMEEKGIDAKAQISFTNQRKADNSNIITGSMRTVEGLKWVCKYGTVPTIGTRVWDKLFDEVSVKEFKQFWDQPEKTADPLFSPTVDEKMTSLSKSFFEQMDDLGRPVNEEFSNI